MSNRWTWHGGGLTAARDHFGRGAEPWLDLSTGINPHGWPGANGIAIDWRRLPDERALQALEAAAAAYFGCDPAHVCALPGTEIGLRLIGDLLPGPAYHMVPSYRTHCEMLPCSTALSLDQCADADGAVLVLANPNNPDGRLLDRKTLEYLLVRRGPGGWLVIDEAFVDCHPGYSLAPQVADSRRLLIFRSFGKFFGLAGVRLGFLLGPRQFIARLRERLGAWPVSAAAIAIGVAAYRDAAWIETTRDRLIREARALDAMLIRLGFYPKGTCPLFRLIEVADASALFDRLARQSILTRPFDHKPNWLRVGLPGSAAALARLEQSLGHG